MNVVDALYAEYGEGAPRGRGPSNRAASSSEGNAYLTHEFAKHGLHQEGDHREIAVWLVANNRIINNECQITCPPAPIRKMR